VNPAGSEPPLFLETTTMNEHNEDLCTDCGEQESDNASGRCDPCERDKHERDREMAYDARLAEWKDER
jgi:hypothetical protein